MIFLKYKTATAHAKDGEKDRDDNVVTQQGAVWMLEAHVLMDLNVRSIGRGENQKHCALP